MAETPVSVIINNFNYGRFLAAAIDSALAQDHGAVEVIVVDDGSTDHSRDVIARFRPRVQVVLKENGGQGSAFNAGFAASRGQVVNFLDADDLLMPEAARRAAAAFSDPGLAQWMTPLSMIDAAGRPLGTRFPTARLPWGDLSRRALDYGPWAYQTTPNTGNFWARWYLEKVLPMPEERFRIGGDEYLAAIAPLYGRLASSNVPAGCYRAHGDNHYWRGRLGMRDVADDCRYFERIADLLTDHARRRGMAVEPERWLRRDWRQQMRGLALHLAGMRAERPQARELLRAVLADQTHPVKKAMLLPLVGMVAALPREPAVSLALKLLQRR